MDVLARIVSLVAVVALAVAACGSSDDDAADPVDGGTAVTDAADEHAESDDVTSDGPTSLDELADGPKSSAWGWAMPPGTYRADVLGDMELATTTELIAGLVDDALVTITTADAPGDFVTYIGRPDGFMRPELVGVHTHDVDVTVDVPEDLTAYFDRVEALRVVDSGDGTIASGEGFRWWDVEIGRNGDGFHCHIAYGPQCTVVAVVAGHTTETEIPAIARFVQLDSQLGVVLWAQAQGQSRPAANQTAAADLLMSLVEGLDWEAN